MVIIELTYKKSINIIEKHLQAHRDFLEKYYQQNLFIASGPKMPREGGFILALTDKETAEKLITEDPFFVHDIADYRISEFIPVKYHACLSDLFG